MRWPFTKCEFIYLIFFSLYILADLSDWTVYEKCSAPTQIFLVGSELTLFALTLVLILLRAPDITDSGVKCLTNFIYWILTPLCLYLPIQGAYWQIQNIRNSPNCRAVTSDSFGIWTWILCLFVVGVIFGYISYLKLRNWVRIYLFRKRMMRLNHLVAEGDISALNALLLENGDINDKVGLVQRDIDKLETKDFSQSFAEMLTGSESHTCPICYEDYKTGDRVIKLPRCEHSFHPECVTGWLMKNPLCPMCRGNVRSGLYDAGSQGRVLCDIENPAC